MKGLILLLISIVFSISLEAQIDASKKTYTGTFPTYITALQFVDADTGFAGGITGRGTPLFLKTTNAGKSWTQINTGLANYQVMKISFLNSNLGFIQMSGSDDGIFKTTNGGNSWTKVLTKGRDITFAGRKSLYALCQDSINPNRYNIYKSSDLGKTWVKKQNLRFYGKLTHCSPNDVTFYSYWTHIYNSTDGFNTYDSIPANNNISALHMLHRDSIYWIDEEANFVSYENKKATYNKITTKDTGLASLAFLHSKKIIIGTESGTVFLSADKGTSWRRLSVIKTPSIGSVAYPSSDVAIAADYNGALYQLTKTPVFIKDNESESNFANIYPSPAEDFINLEIGNYEKGNYSIIDPSGKIWKSGKAGNNVSRIDIQNLPKGIYLIRITTQRGQETVKFMK